MNTDKQYIIKKGIKKEVTFSLKKTILPLILIPFILQLISEIVGVNVNINKFILGYVVFLIAYSNIKPILVNRYYRVDKKIHSTNKSTRNKEKFSVETCLVPFEFLTNYSWVWSTKGLGKEGVSLDDAQMYFKKKTVQEEIINENIGGIKQSINKPTEELKLEEGNELIRILTISKIGFLLYALPLLFILMSFAETTRKSGLSLFWVATIYISILLTVHMLKKIYINKHNRYFRVVNKKKSNGDEIDENIKFQSCITVRKMSWVIRNENQIKWKNIDIDSLDVDCNTNFKRRKDLYLYVLGEVGN